MLERECCALSIKFVLVAVIDWFIHTCILTPCNLMLKKPLFARKHVYFLHCSLSVESFTLQYAMFLPLAPNPDKEM